MKTSRSAFIGVGLFSFFINLLMLTGPIFMLQIYDRVLSSRSIPTLVVLFALVAGLFIIMGILELIRSRVLARIGANISRKIRQDVFDGSMKLSLQTGGDERSLAPIRELDIIKQYLSGPGFVVLFDAPWVPVYIGVIFLFHPMLGWLSVFAAIILFIIAILNDLRARKPAKKIAATQGQINNLAEIGRRNGEALAAMGMMKYLRSLWGQKHDEGLIEQTFATDKMGTLSAISKSFRLFVQSAMLAAGALFVIYGEITAGVMIAASIILGRALQPIEQAITHWRSFIRYREAKNNIKKLLSNIPRQGELTALDRPKGNILVEGLALSAPNSKKIILRNINLKIPQGRIVGILGDSGSGKTSLARALIGVWKPLGGKITIDGATYDQWEQDELGKYFGYLPQDVELFDGTIAQNISRLEPNPDSQKILEAAKQAGAHEMIKNLGGYDMPIGIGGSNLSAGQRQRVALARALYGDPVFLVLDEPNSNLDESGDFALFEAIKGMKQRGQTVIIIAHRKNILELCDDLVVLHEGRQVAYGPKNEVLAKIRERQAQQSAKRRKNKQSANRGEIIMPGFQIIAGGNPQASAPNIQNPTNKDKENE